MKKKSRTMEWICEIKQSTTIWMFNDQKSIDRRGIDWTNYIGDDDDDDDYDNQWS
mgnify:FL=1